MIHAELWSAGKFDDAYFNAPEEVVEWAKGRSHSYNLVVDTRPEDSAKGIFLTIMIRDSGLTHFYDQNTYKEMSEGKVLAEIDKWADKTL